MEIHVEIEGVTPLLMSKFTDAAAVAIENGTSQVLVGDKKTPRAQAEAALYADSNGKPIFPGPNIFRAIIDAGVFHKVGKSKVTTMKSSLVPAGITVKEIECPIVNPDGGAPKWEVDSRSIVVQITMRKMAHRPRFDRWRLKFTLDVDDTMFSEGVVRLLIDDAGKKIGLGAFRPSRKGPFGKFVVVGWRCEKTKVKETKAA